jgi:hypothetical protein
MMMKLDLTLIIGLAGLLIIASGLEARVAAAPTKTVELVADTAQPLNVNCPKTAEQTKADAPVGSLSLVVL